MPPEPRQRHRPLAHDDPDLRPGWQLLQFLLSIGADEFGLTLMYAGAAGKAECDRIKGRLAFAALGEHTRECTVTYARQSNPRPTAVWRFDAGTLEVLKSILPGGILGPSDQTRAWAEDLCVYRLGELLLGTVTHEQFAFLRLSDAEWREWNAQKR